MRNAKVTAEKYKQYLEMTYGEFCKATTVRNPRNHGIYDYCIRKKDDTPETRLKYINYLINEKHLSFPERMINGKDKIYG